LLPNFNVLRCRVDWPKGVGEFLEASKIAQKWGEKVLFLLVGFRDPYHRNSISNDLLNPTETFRWLGKRDDIKNILALSDIVTLPSYYREGVPRSLLEGMAMGKPIVTTDSVGCRETVDEGVNGYLVPAKDSPALADAIHKLVVNKERREKFGKASLIKVQNEFSYKIVHKKILHDLLGIENPEIPDIKTNVADDGMTFLNKENS
jgi:N,N'-diacetylbacillosaminyl-diphospho-undecaprenol alpha-1,3-N-acetylgalactosaminyltransferase